MSSSMTPLADDVAIESFEIWSTSAVLGVTDPSQLSAARSILNGCLLSTERAASRFHEGTEIISLNAAAGMGPVPVSAVLFDLVEVAIDAARMTSGACDPTVADAVLAQGYDDDFDLLPEDRDLPRAVRVPGTAGITLDRATSTISLPLDVHLDLGATAKARTADLAALAIAEQLGCGALVDLGGDLRIAGPVPHGGWRIGITDQARTLTTNSVAETVAVTAGGIASSSSRVRTWRAGGMERHHVIDPATGESANTPWRMVSIAAATATEANALSTAALVWGDEALFELPQRNIAARLVRHDGTIERVGGWPEPIAEDRS